MRFIKASELRWLVGSLVVLVLIAASINVPFAITRIRSRTGKRPGQSLYFRGAEAGARGWPAKTPHDRPWTGPTSITAWSSFGYREYDARVPNPTENMNGFSMEVQHLGWPFPVIEIKQMWWNWDDPALQGPEPDPRPTLMPLGLVVNPLLVVTPVWFLLFLLPLALIMARRATRS